MGLQKEQPRLIWVILRQRYSTVLSHSLFLDIQLRKRLRLCGYGNKTLRLQYAPLVASRLRRTVNGAVIPIKCKIFSPNNKHSWAFHMRNSSPHRKNRNVSSKYKLHFNIQVEAARNFFQYSDKWRTFFTPYNTTLPLHYTWAPGSLHYVQPLCYLRTWVDRG